MVALRFLRLMLALLSIGSIASHAAGQSCTDGWDPSSPPTDAADHGDGFRSEVTNSTYLADGYINLETNFEGKVVDGVQQRESTAIVVKVYRAGVLIHMVDLGTFGGDNITTDRISWNIAAGDEVEVNVTFSGGGGVNHMSGTMTL